MDCTVSELNGRMANVGEEFLLLDVRTGYELELASLEGATHIPMDEIEARAGELNAWKTREIVVMCHHGMRSAAVQAFLLQAGFQYVRNLTGGIDAYSRGADGDIPVY